MSSEMKQARVNVALALAFNNFKFCLEKDNFTHTLHRV